LAASLALPGCRQDHSQYKYSGKIGVESVVFTEEKFLYSNDFNILTVITPDGRNIEYKDTKNDDLRLESVIISTNNSKQRYDASDEVGKAILEEGQKKFDGYLQQILAIKTKQGLENLK